MGRNTNNSLLAVTNLARIYVLNVVAILMVAGFPAPSYAIKIKLDYTYDFTDFYGAGNPGGPAAGAEARSSAKAAAKFFESILTDDLKSIKPKKKNKWTAKFHNPSGGGSKKVRNLKVSEDTIVIFMGAKPMSDAAGRAAPGWVTGVSGSDKWEERVEKRGSSKETEGKKAKDFTPWGGHITMNQAGRGYWHFNHFAPPAEGKVDFYAVLLHEMGHVLGIGTADSWDNKIKGGRFTGKKSKAANNGVAPRVLGDKSHWGHNMISPVFVYGVLASTRMDHDSRRGVRESFTNLDVAALKDIGWKVRTRADPFFVPPPPHVQQENNDLYAAGTPFASVPFATNHTHAKAVVVSNFMAIDSATFSGVPVAIALHQQGGAASRAATRNLNNRLSRLRAGLEASESVESNASGQTNRTEGPVEIQDPRAGMWNLFAGGDFAVADQDALGKLTSGSNSETMAGSIGVERKLTNNLAMGLAWSYLDHQVDLGPLGDLSSDGHAASIYATARRGRLYTDLLYSYGEFETDVTRNTGAFRKAKGTADSQSHRVDLNAGLNFQVTERLTTGPIVAARYVTGQVDSFSESGAGAANLRYLDQNFDSLETQLGWQASVQWPTKFGRAILQGHVAWERENFNEEERVSVELEQSPYLLFDRSGFTNVGDFEVSSAVPRPGSDYLSAGAALILSLGDLTEVSLDVEHQFFRDSLDQTFGGIRFTRRF